MSDNASTEVQQQQMKKIFICDDAWYEIFAFVHPFELGLKMALISDRLDVLVDVHFKSREWLLGWLQIRRATDGNGAEIVKHFPERLPIPQGPIPNSVIGFERIEINFVDKTVVEFLQHFRRLFDSSGTNVYIETNYGQRRTLYWRLLVRCPIVRDEGKWAEWEEAAIVWVRSRQRNCVVIAFEDKDIGEGMTYKRKST
uniref:F-box domain-containing protein n=1 Tax=Globodera pallida TaxID=36090 RepID=A0A183C538_GLOPA